MTEKEIAAYLVEKLQNKYGAFGLMGNLYAESGLIANNLQNSYQSKLGFTDETYTAAVDSGAYNNFVNDGAGYGLAQWTYWTRKRDLLAFAKRQGKSIGDTKMQLDFLIDELGRYFSGVLFTLRTADSIREASDAVLLNFERPANMSEANQIRRANIGQAYYDKYATEDDEMTQEKFNEMMDAYLAEQAKKAPSSWSAKAREWAEGLGIIKGTGTQMEYKRPVTREEIAEMLYRFSQK